MMSAPAPHPRRCSLKPHPGPCCTAAHTAPQLPPQPRSCRPRDPRARPSAFARGAPPRRRTCPPGAAHATAPHPCCAPTPAPAPLSRAVPLDDPLPPRPRAAAPGRTPALIASRPQAAPSAPMRAQMRSAPARPDEPFALTHPTRPYAARHPTRRACASVAHNRLGSPQHCSPVQTQLPAGPRGRHPCAAPMRARMPARRGARRALSRPVCACGTPPPPNCCQRSCPLTLGSPQWADCLTSTHGAAGGAATRHQRAAHVAPQRAHAPFGPCAPAGSLLCAAPRCPLRSP